MRAWCVAILGALTAVAAPVEAAPSARLVYLRGTGAEQCPDEPAVRAAVSARLGYDPFFPWASSTMFAEISRDKSQYRARIKLVDDANTVRGERELVQQGGRCKDIIDAMALSMSIAIDPLSLARRPSTPPAQPLPPDAGPVDPLEGKPDAPGPQLTPQSKAPRRSGPEEDFAVPEEPLALATAPPPRLEATLAGGGAVGVLPAANGRGLVGLRVPWGPWSLAIEGHMDLPRTASRGAGELRATVVGAHVTPCVELPVSRLAPFGCISLFVGALSAQGSGVLRPDSARTLFVSAGPRLGVALPVSSALRPFIAAEAGFTPTRVAMTLDGRVAYEQGPISLAAFAGVAVRLF